MSDEALTDEIDKGLGLKSMHVEDGVAHVSMTTEGAAKEAVLVMLDGLADMLGDATNYVEFDLRRHGKSPVSVCVRRMHHPTPHDLRVKAEQERDGALAELERLTAREESFRTTLREHFKAVEDRALANGNTASETSRHANEMAGLWFAIKAFEDAAS